jgi:hypothetical protein
MNHGKIKNGPLKDREVVSEQKDGYISVKCGEQQVACITPNSGTTVQDVVNTLEPKF